MTTSSEQNLSFIIRKKLYRGQTAASSYATCPYLEVADFFLKIFARDHAVGIPTDKDQMEVKARNKR